MTPCKIAQPDDRRNISKNIFMTGKNHTNDSSNSIPKSRKKEAASADDIVKAPFFGLSRLDCTQPSKNKNQLIEAHTQIIVIELKAVQTKFRAC